MPVNTCKRKPFGQKCQNQIIALVPLSRIKIWFVLFIFFFLQNHIFKSFFEKCNFCFPPYVCVWLFLFFSLLFSITLPPVQTLNPIGKNVPNLQFWVSFRLIETRWFEKAEDCLFDWFVSIFKFCFLNNFSLYFFHQFRNFFSVQIGILFADLRFPSLQRELLSLKSSRFLALFPTSSYSNLIFETTSVFLQTGCQPTFFSGTLPQNWSMGCFLSLESKSTAVFFDWV